MSNIFKAGAGEAKIAYSPAMFPTGGHENYTGVHDYPYVHVVLLEQDVRRAIVCYDLVTIPDAEKLKKLACELLGVEESNLILLNPHVLTTPHNVTMGPPGKTDFPPEVLAKQALMDEANETALKNACAAAAESLRPAKFGYAKGYTNFNVNRVVVTDKGWSQGTCDEGDCDHDMPVFRFDDLDGNTIAIMYIVNCAAGMLENTRSDDGGRLVSNDIAGASADFVRKEFPGAVAFYLCGATGDQWQELRGMFGTVGRGGVYRERDLGDKGWFLLELMGERLGQQIVRAADSIVCGDVDKITLTKHEIMLPGRVMFRGGPGGVKQKAPLVKGDDVKVVVSLMAFDDVLWIGSTPEIMVSTIRAIKEASPYAQTAFSGWTNQGEGSSGTYMAEEVMYEQETYQSAKSAFYKGAAEMFRDTVISLVGAEHGKE